MDARSKQAKRRAKADAQSRTRSFSRRRTANLFFFAHRPQEMH
jgi:hypothetical protein